MIMIRPAGEISNMIAYLESQRANAVNNQMPFLALSIGSHIELLKWVIYHDAYSLSKLKEEQEDGESEREKN